MEKPQANSVSSYLSSVELGPITNTMRMQMTANNSDLDIRTEIEHTHTFALLPRSRAQGNGRNAETSEIHPKNAQSCHTLPRALAPESVFILQCAKSAAVIVQKE